MTMITPSYLGETIEYSSLHACRSTLEDPTGQNTESITQKGQSLGLTQEKFQESGLRAEVAKRQRDAGVNIEIRQETHAEKIAPLQEKVDTARGETVIGGNMKQIWNSGSEAAVDAYDYLTSQKNSPKPQQKEE